MQIAVFGSNKKKEELKLKFEANQNIDWLDSVSSVNDLKSDAIVFDLDFDHAPSILDWMPQMNQTIFVNAIQKSLTETLALVNAEFPIKVYGMNALKGFINLPKWELSAANTSDSDALGAICQKLNTPFHLIADRVGLATPRVIFMIINEAAFTLQEGTATIEAIDQAMKLGTNYPKGPFEWADQIGIQEVYEGLRAVFEDTGDPRYKVCPLLKQQYLTGASFYS